jgi:hypothetical protein
MSNHESDPGSEGHSAAQHINPSATASRLQRREYVAAVVGVIAPLLIDAAYHTQLNNYMPHKAVSAGLIAFSGLGIPAFVLATIIKNKLLKFLPDFDYKKTAVDVARLNELGAERAWTLFWLVNGFGNLLAFFVCFAISVFFLNALSSLHE